MNRLQCRLALSAALLQAALVGCEGRVDRPASPERAARPGALATAPGSASERPRSAPPTPEFVAPQPWQSRREGTPPIAPPALETWRALVSQNQPLQVKTPLWQSLPPKETVELNMPAGSRFRCMVTPLSVTAEADDFNTELEAWLLARTLLCSPDDFSGWTEHAHHVRVLPDGARSAPESGALLRERDADQTVRHSYVLLRSDEESRAASTGAPRILPGAPVDAD